MKFLPAGGPARQRVELKHHERRRRNVARLMDTFRFINGLNPMGYKASDNSASYAFFDKVAGGCDCIPPLTYAVQPTLAYLPKYRLSSPA